MLGSSINLMRSALLLTVFLVSGCSGMRLIDSQVASFAPKTIATGASYQFERLPSQIADPVNQSRLETLAERALGKVGLLRQNSAPLLVQVSAVQRQESKFLYGDVGIGWVFGNGVLVSQGAQFPGLETQISYWRQVSLIIRDRAGEVVFESHASHEGVWADSDVVLAALMDAALQGFPNPTPGVRRVNIEIPR